MAGKGNAKTGGRVKGVPNKLNRSAQQLLDSMGCNPIEAMAKALQLAIDANDQQMIVHIADKLAPYHSPKLASTKLEGGVDVKHDLIGLSETDALLSKASKGKGKGALPESLQD